MQKKVYWHKLDNAAKIFPATSKEGRSNVFRISFYMNEEVNPNILSQAVDKNLIRFQVFKTQLKNGLFWNYFAENKKPFKVEPESPLVSKHFKFNKNNGYMFKVFYFQNKITLETFHSLSDGRGALEFLKSIVYTYIELKGYNLSHDNLILGERPFSNKENEDSFDANYNPKNKLGLKEEKAYHIKGDKFSDNWALLINLQLDSDKLIQMVKTKYNTTITKYLTTVMASSIIEEGLNVKKSKKVVKMFVPVDLRPFFNSITLRNFSLYIKCAYDPKKVLSFEEMLELTNQMFVEQLTKDDLEKRIGALVSLEKNIFLRFVPLIIKNLVFKLAYQAVGESITTTSLSNIGIVKLPKSLAPFVENVEFSNSGKGINLGVVSYENITNLTFNSAIKDISIINKFVRMLKDDGLEVTLDTNYREVYDEIL